jgi:zinc/manganese transport system substrate-binding protein
MKKQTQLAIVVVVAVALVGGGAYAVLTSSGPANPCDGTTAGPAPSSSAASALTGAGTGGTPDPRTLPGTMGTQLREGSHPTGSAAGPVQVVAAENFWGSLVAQLGGNNTSVLSIVTDPNADPHEYEANTSDAIAISDAQLVVVNGVGYDDWALQLVAADGNSGQLVLNAGLLNGVNVTGGIVTGNPHLWYNPVYVNRTVAQMFSDLVQLQPSSVRYFQANYAALNASLSSLYGRATEIKHTFAGTEVAATESIFVYLANFTGLDLVSPPAFMEAIAEGNDPPTQSVVTFQCQLESGQVKVLVYNEQTETPLTNQMKSIASQYNVTLVAVTETIQPPGVDFQTWMNAEYLELQNALNSNLLGQ